MVYGNDTADDFSEPARLDKIPWQGEWISQLYLSGSVWNHIRPPPISRCHRRHLCWVTLPTLVCHSYCCVRRRQNIIHSFKNSSRCGAWWCWRRLVLSVPTDPWFLKNQSNTMGYENACRSDDFRPSSWICWFISMATSLLLQNGLTVEWCRLRIFFAAPI